MADLKKFTTTLYRYSFHTINIVPFKKKQKRNCSTPIEEALTGTEELVLGTIKYKLLHNGSLNLSWYCNTKTIRVYTEKMQFALVKRLFATLTMFPIL